VCGAVPATGCGCKRRRVADGCIQIPIFRIMSALAISLLIFAVMLASSWLGSSLRTRLPAHHLSDESKDSIKVAIGGVTTLAALVLGLLVGSAKSSFDTKYSEIQQAAAKILLLDTTLRQLGPDADAARELMRTFVTAKVDYTWIDEQSSAIAGSDAMRARAVAPITQLERLIAGIAVATDDGRRLQSRALQLAEELALTRWLLIEQSGSSISVPLLTLLVLWLGTIGMGVSLLAPRNGTVRAIGLLCIFAVASTIFVVLEMDDPFRGLIRISETPLRNAIAILDRR
jgi:hypothetical protein